MATIQDVARRAGVSTATVSHVVNNTRFVSVETRAAVLDAVRELNYHPSAAARSLSTRKTRTIGVVVSDISDFFFAELVRGVMDAIAPHDYHLLLCDTSRAWEDEYLRLRSERTVDGFIITPANKEWVASQRQDAECIPTVFADCAFEGTRGPYVGVDNEGGACRAVSHLIDDGHRRIGIAAGPRGLPTMEERLAGYRRALREHGLAVDERLIACSTLSVDDGRMSAIRLLSTNPPPSALFCSNDLLTLGTLRAIRQLGWKCPDDVGLAGFDDHPWARTASPALTVVRQPAREIGRTAGLLLMRMLSGEAVEDRVVLPTELIVRESCRARTACSGRRLAP